MKKLAIAAVLASVFAAPAALAATGDTVNANLVFKGKISSVVPSGAITVTGVGGGVVPEGALNINPQKEITTQTPVTFEVRELGNDGVVGDKVTSSYKLKLQAIPSLAVDGNNVINNTHNTVYISHAGGTREAFETAGKEVTRTATGAFDATETVYFENLGTGAFDAEGQVGEPGVGAGTGSNVTATIALLVTDARPTTPEPV